MNQQREIDLVDDLLSRGPECPWLEYKSNNANPKMIGTLCSAISNGARLAGHDFGYILWGICDQTHQIIGTTFQPTKERPMNQDLQFSISSKLKPDLA